MKYIYGLSFTQNFFAGRTFCRLGQIFGVQLLQFLLQNFALCPATRVDEMWNYWDETTPSVSSFLGARLGVIFLLWFGEL